MKRWMLATVVLFVCAGYMFAGVAAAADEAIWIEGEDFSQSNFNDHGWYGNVREAALSNEDWACHYDKSNGAGIEWTFEVKEGGTYTWYIRLNTFQIAHDYAFDQGELKTLSVEETFGERVNLTPKGIDIRFAQWVKAGEVELEAGEHSLMMMIQAGEREAHSGIDCMALVNFDWTPSGLKKPEMLQTEGMTEEERKAELEKLLKNPMAEATQETGEEKAYIWIEGENVSKTSFFEHSWYHNVQTMMLSGRDWVSHFNSDLEGEAHYKFKVEKEGKYALWLRANYTRNTVKYRMDAGEPVKVKVKAEDRVGRVQVSKTIDIRFVSWANIGEFELKEGEHVLTVIFAKSEAEGDKGINHHGGIDCLCLTNMDWKPSATNKPKLPEKEEKDEGSEE